ncbi:hypothetical protein [Streptosporangium roseum]|uniref:hypothetical protein n=1 Tax=Streptosporangium roseum TaxID=2001 RepID=UPI0001A39B66|nr:hypothetical protein [Streptosporangium roseum]
MADAQLHADGDYRAELARWTTEAPRSDGIPPDHLGPGGGAGTLTRDFGQLPAGDIRWETCPQLAVLTTRDDQPLDWLRAGQAVQRVLLIATLYGVSASFLYQPLDLRDMRGRTDPRHHRAHPQMIIRFGYGPAVLDTPRRPVSDILETA